MQSFTLSIMSTILHKVGEVNCQPFFEGCYNLKHELIYIF